jgi:hypothetical protein
MQLDLFPKNHLSQMFLKNLTLLMNQMFLSFHYYPKNRLFLINQTFHLNPNYPMNLNLTFLNYHLNHYFHLNLKNR